MSQVALMYGVVFAILGLSAWAIRASGSIQFLMMATAIVGAGFDYYSVYQAEIQLNELLGELKKRSK